MVAVMVMVMMMGGGKESEDMVGVGWLAKSRCGHTIHGHGGRGDDNGDGDRDRDGDDEDDPILVSWLRVGKGIGTGFAITPLPSKHLLLPDHQFITT